MSDSQLSIDDALALTVDQFNGFLGRSGVEHQPCSACGKTGELVILVDAEKRPHIFYQHSYRNPDVVATYFIVKCRACLLTSFFDAIDVAREVALNGDTDAE